MKVFKPKTFKTYPLSSYLDAVSIEGDKRFEELLRYVSWFADTRPDLRAGMENESKPQRALVKFGDLVLEGVQVSPQHGNHDYYLLPVPKVPPLPWYRRRYFRLRHYYWARLKRKLL